ncbi:hypothetical protein HK101_003253 [Irineochytrium annulatum]|nr:hypothetical protein HK101_003253 [Irineochytrium annulatum]
MATRVLWAGDAVLDATTGQIFSSAATTPTSRPTCSQLVLPRSPREEGSPRPSSTAWRADVYLRSVTHVTICCASPCPSPYGALLDPSVFEGFLRNLQRVSLVGAVYWKYEGSWRWDALSFREQWIGWLLEQLQRRDGPKDLLIGTVEVGIARRLRDVCSVRKLQVINTVGVNIETFVGLEHLVIHASGVQFAFDASAPRLVTHHTTLKQLGWGTSQLQSSIPAILWRHEAAAPFLTSLLLLHGSLATRDSFDLLHLLMAKSKCTLLSLEAHFSQFPGKFVEDLREMETLKIVKFIIVDSLEEERWHDGSELGELIAALSRLQELDYLSLTCYGRHDIVRDINKSSFPLSKRVELSQVDMKMNDASTRLEAIKMLRGKLVVDGSTLLTYGLPALQELHLADTAVVSADGENLNEQFRAVLESVALTPNLCKLSWEVSGGAGRIVLQDWKHGIPGRRLVTE